MTTAGLTPQQRTAGGTLLGLSALIAAVSFLEPGATPWLPSCPFHALTGLYCPGCGSTRMLYLLIHGHPLLAFHENAISMIVLPVVIYVLIRQLMGQRIAVAPRLTPRWGTAFAVILLLFTVARNIPAEPFQSLAPQPIPQVR